MLLLGIIGHPLAHTLSPKLHNWACSQQNIPGAYYVWDILAPKIPAYIAALRTLPIHGLSVTIPHKETIIPLLDRLTDTARDIGAVNTLFWQDGQLWGDNTDVTGFMAPLRERTLSAGTALVLGAGGAARAAVYGLRQAGWKVYISARTEAKALAQARTFQAEHIPWNQRHDLRPDLLLNTTPLGMAGPFSAMSPWKEGLEGIGLVYDLIYNPRHTPLVAQAVREGVEVIYGLPMFVYQAMAQFERWTGARFSFEGAVQLLEDALSQKKGG